VLWDKNCDGTAQPVAELPIPAEAGVPPHAAPITAVHMPYYLAITGFSQPARTGTTVPLRFHFRHAGVVTVAAMVQPRDRSDEPARYACTAVRTPGRTSTSTAR
jgi:hypothetical protein